MEYTHSKIVFTVYGEIQISLAVLYFYLQSLTNLIPVSEQLHGNTPFHTFLSV